MASTAAVLSVLVKADMSKAVTGLATLQKRLESASKSADELTDKLFYLSQLRITPKVDFDDGGADAKIDALQAKLDRLGAGEVTAKVEVATEQAHAELDRFANSDVTVHGSFDLDTGAAEAKIELLKRQAAGIGGGISGGGGGAIGSAGSSGGSIFSPLSFAFANPIASAVAVGAPLLPTVGASLAQGALGLGALGTAGAGAGAVGGAGIASVAIGGITDLSAALKAYDTQQQAAGANAVQLAQQQLSAASAQHAAAQQVQTAEEGLTTAQQQETFAQQALTLARKDAVRQLTDMRRAATESTTAEQQAKLNLEVARRALAQAPAGTSQLELRQLQLSAKEAQQAFRDAGIARDRAHQDANKAQSQGVSQMPQVVAAQRSLEAAQKGVADASRNVKQAEYAQAQAMKQSALQAKALAISQNQLGLAMKQLPASGQAVVRMLHELGDRWEKISKPAQNQFFGLISDGIHEVNKLLPMFADSAERSMRAARRAFGIFLKALDSPTFKKFIDVMTKTFAKSVGPLTQVFTNLFKILMRIAIAAAPALIQMLRAFREMTGDWLKSTKNAHDLRDSVNGVIDQFMRWLGLIGAVGEVLGALFLSNNRGAKAGGDAIGSLTDTLQGWADWINTHHQQVNDFFIGILHTIETLASGVAGLVTAFAPLTSAIAPIAKAIGSIAGFLNGLKIGNISALTALLGAFAAKGLASKVGGLFPAAASAAAKPGTALPPGVPIGAGAAPATESVTQGLTSRLGAVKNTVSKYFSGVGSRLGTSVGISMVGSIGSQLVGGKMGDNINAAAQGAAAGFAIGGPWGAAGGAAAGFFIKAFMDNTKGAVHGQIVENMGAALGGAIQDGVAKKILHGKTIGEALSQSTKDALTAAGVGTPQLFSAIDPKKGVKGLEALGRTAKAVIQNLKETGGDPQVIAGWEQFRREIKDNVGGINDFNDNLRLMRRNTGASVGQITGIMHRNKDIISKTWGLDSKKGRQEQAKNLKAAVGNVEAAVRRQDISVKRGEELKARLIRQSKVVNATKKQADNMGKAWGSGIAKAGDVTKKGMQNIVGTLKDMSDGAAKVASEGLLNRLRDARKEGDISDKTYRTMKGKILSTFSDLNIKTSRSTDNLTKGLAGAYKAVTDTVSGKGGMQTMGQNINDVLDKLGIKKKVQFQIEKATAFTSHHWASAQKGAQVATVPGSSTGDQHMLTLNGNPIAKVESGEGIFVGNRNMMAVAKKMNAQIPRFAKGGGVKYSLPWPGGTSQFGELDRGIDVGGTGPVFAMDSGTVTRPNFNLFSNYGSATSGLVYKMDHPPKGYSPSSPYVYIYELFNPAAGASGRIRAGQTLGNITGGSGIEMGWAANASGQPLADALGENIAARHSLPRGLPTSISLQNFIRDVQAGKHIAGGAVVEKLKRLILDGPKGALKDAGQGALDKVVKAANSFLSEQTPKTTMGGGANVFPTSSGALSKGQMRKLMKAHHMPDIMGYVSYAESGWNPSSVNSIGASGLWQILMPLNSGVVHGNVLDPDVNAEAAMALYRASGLSPWDASKYAGQGGGWAQHLGEKFRRGGMINMPPFGGSFQSGGVVPGPIGSPRTVVAHGGERIDSKGSRYQITITNWKQGTGYMEEIADGAVNGQRRLGNQLSRMSRA